MKGSSLLEIKESIAIRGDIIDVFTPNEKESSENFF